MFADIDDVGILLDDVGKCDSGSYQIILDSQFMKYLENAGIEKNVLFNGVFAYTLSRFIGSENILFNTVLDEKNSVLLVNCENQDASSFMNYVAALIENISKYDCPFEEIESEYDAKSNIMFQYSADNDAVTDLSFDFNAYVSLKDKNYILNIIYSEKYSEFMVKRFAQSYNLILSQILNVNDLSDINYTTLSDLEFLDTYNQNDYHLNYDDILEAFNDNLAKYPDNKLVLYNDAVYSYAESAFIADRIAKKLADLGVGFQDNVAFLVNRSELYLFNVLAILSMGAVYVPLDTNLPDERIEFILEDTDSKVLIVSDETYEYAENMDNNHVLLNVSDIVRKETGTLSRLPVNYGDLACILYTSGTTGVPKGVKITRKSILNVAEWYVEEYDFGKDDVYGMFSSIGFDVASFNITVVMLAGACLAIVPDDCKSDMAKLNEYYIQHGVNHAWITTSVGKLFMHSVDITSLDILICGGEKLGDFESPKDYTLIDVCGPTEAFEHVYSIKNSDKMDSSSIGYLNYNTKAYLLDDEFRRIPVGAVGELYLAGYQIADGYLNREKETAEAFIHNPFDDGEYKMLYRTGDMVRFLSDGSLAIVGRSDNQVKVRGNRVELSEIESIVRELSYINDVTIQTIKNGTNNELVAYIVLKDGFDEEYIEDSLRDYVAEHKPDYMVPSYVIGLDEIPLNINGKVDKKALPDVNLKDLQSEYVAPTNDAEKTIVKAFEKVFNQKIGIYDDFVKLGGDSLTAIKAISLMDMDINPTAIFNGRTPYAIAQIIGKKEYGFDLVKKGNKNQNMFLLPPVGGLSFVFFDLVNNIDFDGNIYLIDDFKYDLSLDELKTIRSNDITFNHYYDAIKDIFQNGDIIVGFSLGCIYASLLCEKLEQNKQVAKCILIDGTLKFVNDEETSTEELIKEYCEVEYSEVINNRSGNFQDKFIEILRINSNWNFHTPKIECPVTYLATSDVFKGDLDKISDNHKFVLIDSNHKDILHKDIDKIIKYFK